jgi:hypothetical protein
MKKIFIISIFVLLLSCEKDSSKTYTCTTYLNGAVWSTTTVDKCENCSAPQGYTTTCKEN